VKYYYQVRADDLNSVIALHLMFRGINESSLPDLIPTVLWKQSFSLDLLIDFLISQDVSWDSLEAKNKEDNKYC